MPLTVRLRPSLDASSPVKRSPRLPRTMSTEEAGPAPAAVRRNASHGWRSLRAALKAASSSPKDGLLTPSAAAMSEPPGTRASRCATRELKLAGRTNTKSRTATMSSSRPRSRRLPSSKSSAARALFRLFRSKNRVIFVAFPLCGDSVDGASGLVNRTRPVLPNLNFGRNQPHLNEPAPAAAGAVIQRLAAPRDLEDGLDQASAVRRPAVRAGLRVEGLRDVLDPSEYLGAAPPRVLLGLEHEQGGRRVHAAGQERAVQPAAQEPPGEGRGAFA